MSKRLWSIWTTAPAMVGSAMLLVNPALAQTNSVAETLAEVEAIAQNEPTADFATPATNLESPNSELLEQIDSYSNEEFNGSMGADVQGASKFRDVSPGDWAYQALDDLVKRYDCLVGYPNGTFRGNRSLSRYEFAAGLNACLNQIERLIAAATADFMTREDLENIRKLMEQFEAELIALGTRIDNLEARTSFLEDHQFSTTTKLNGEVVFSVAALSGGTVGGNEVDDSVIFGDRVRLNFDTSFTGKDRLRVRLQARALISFASTAGTDMARLGHDGGSSASPNDLSVSDLYYRFPVGDNVRLYVGTSSFDFDDFVSPTNPLFDSSAGGALNRFTRKNPFIYRPIEGSGFGASIGLTDNISLDLAYLTDSSIASNPSPGQGLFNGSYTAGAQLNFSDIGDALDVSFAYQHIYYSSSDVNLTGSTGSSLGKRPFGQTPTSADRFGIQAHWRVTDTISIGGWGGYQSADREIGGGTADLWTWLANIGIVDVGKEGSVLGFMFGMPPRLTRNTVGATDPDTAYIAEIQYRYPVNKNIVITPGVYAIFNPNHNSANDTIFVGAIRTRFKF